MVTLIGKLLGNCSYPASFYRGDKQQKELSFYWKTAKYLALNKKRLNLDVDL